MQFLVKGNAYNLPNVRGRFVAIQWQLSRSAEDAEVLALIAYFRKELKTLKRNYIEVYILEEVPQTASL